MSRLRQFVFRLLNFLRPERMEREVARELRAHLTLIEDELRRRGLPPDEARVMARKALGNLDHIKEQHRDARSFQWLDDTRHDLRYGWRALVRAPGFAAVAVLTLGLGIGANTAIFTLIDALLLRPLPVREPQQLVQLTMVLPGGEVWQSFSYPLVRALAEQQDVFSAVAGFGSASFNVGQPEAVEATTGAWVTGDYFDALGLTPAAGRLLTPEDDRPGAVAAVVISDDYWRRRFGRDPQAIGHRLLIGRAAVTIVGVTPARFTGTTVGQTADLTLAVAVLPQVHPDRAQSLEASATWLRVLARPRDGVSPLQAKTRLATLWQEIARAAIPADIAVAQRRAMASTVDVIPGATGWSPLRRQFRRPLLVLMGFVALVLVIACVNVANLLLVRMAARRREMAVRLALGAGRRRIASQLLTESALLAVLGAGLGVALAQAGCRLLVALLSSGRAQAIVLDVTPNGQILGFTSLVAVATTLMVGLAPAFGTTSIQPAAALSSNSGRILGAGGRIGRVLVTAQVALCLLLLVGAGLFVQTLQNLRAHDAGFHHDGVLLVDVDGRQAGYRGAGLVAFNQDLLERVERLPGVRVASFSSVTPLSGGAITQTITIEGQDTGEETYFNNIAPRFFEAMQTPVVQGREFTRHDDAGAGKVVVVNQAFVRRHLRNQRPLGIQLSVGKDPATWQIVGVVADAVYDTMREEPRPTVYAPYLQRGAGAATFEVNVAGSPAYVASAIRAVIQSKMPGVPATVRTLTAQVEQSLSQERLLAVLATTFGVLALVLAAVGLYGLLAYSVARRTSEIGLRMAMGARRTDVLTLVLGQSLALTATGIVLGLCGAAALTRLLSDMLFGVPPLDPSTFVAAAMVFGIVAAIASLLPAHRATRVDPLTAVRFE